VVCLYSFTFSGLLLRRLLKRGLHRKRKENRGEENMEKSWETGGFQRKHKGLNQNQCGK
jgi:hypothetical protein